jgi:hypothetical protein
MGDRCRDCRAVVRRAGLAMAAFAGAGPRGDTGHRGSSILAAGLLDQLLYEARLGRRLDSAEASPPWVAICMNLLSPAPTIISDTPGLPLKNT